MPFNIISRQLMFVLKIPICLLQAEEMVSLSKMIVSKIKDKQGEITEDEVCIVSVFYSKAIFLMIISFLFF